MAEEMHYGLLATVNGRPITVIDVVNDCAWEESRLPLMYQGDELKREVEALRHRTSDRMIERMLVFDDFKSNGFVLPVDYVEANLDHLLKAFNVATRQELEKKLAGFGETMAVLREKTYERIAVDALVYDLCYRDVYISPKEVNSYYQAHPAEFNTPESISLDMLVLKTDGSHKDNLDELCDHLEKKLADADSKVFEDAVALYSEGPNVDKGGNVGWIERGKLRADFMALTKDAPVGKALGPLKAAEACYFLRVAGVRPPSVKAFAAAKDEIKDKLQADFRNKNYQDYLDRLRKKAFVKRFY